MTDSIEESPDIEALKPCPFCGGPGQLESGGPHNPTNWLVSCNACDYSLCFQVTKERAREAWNRRDCIAALGPPASIPDGCTVVPREPIENLIRIAGDYVADAEEPTLVNAINEVLSALCDAPIRPDGVIMSRARYESLVAAEKRAERLARPLSPSKEQDHDRSEIWIIMSRAGDIYEYTDWPIEWRWTEDAAQARVEELTALIERLAASVPACPEVGDSEAKWDRYLAKQQAATRKAEAARGSLEAMFFTVRLVSPRPVRAPQSQIAAFGAPVPVPAATQDAGAMGANRIPQPKPEDRSNP